MNDILMTGGGNTVCATAALSQREWRKGWSFKIKVPFLRLYLYISNTRMKKRPKRDLLYQGYIKQHTIDIKRKLYERQDHKCPHCGREFTFEEMELHHVLSVARYPELKQSIRNGLMLCHDCHKEVHCNPYRNIRMMEEKAKELGIDLDERYELRNNEK